MLFKTFKKENKRCWNCHIKSLILYIRVVQFYRLYMHWRVLIKSRRTEIIYFILRETAFSRYLTNINFCKSSCWKDLATNIFANQAVGKLTLPEVDDLRVKGLFSLIKYMQDYIAIKSFLKPFYRYQHIERSYSDV